jgi:hypothetical protein
MEVAYPKSEIEKDSEHLASILTGYIYFYMVSEVCI